MMSPSSPTMQFAHNTVMVIDDQFMIRKAICRTLKSLGWGTILEASDGVGALKLIMNHPVDLVISDVVMPECDGLETLKNIRGLNFGSDVPVIMVTGEAETSEIVKAVDLGADDYIVKPFHVEDLEKKIVTVLSRYFSPTPLLRLLRDGDRLFVTGKFQDALKCFEAAERLSPDSARAKFGKAMTLKNLGLAEQALDILRRSAEQSPTFFRNFRAIADISLELKLTSLAITALARELEINPKQPERQLLFGRVLKGEGDLLGALHHFQAALVDSPKNKEALLATARTLGDLGEIKSALKIFQRARRYYPAWGKPLELATQLLAAKTDGKTAITFLRDELSRYPDQTDLRVMLARSLAEKSDTQEALKVLDDGLKRSANDVSLLKTKAHILWQSLSYASACALYRQILEIEPNSSNRLHLAKALMRDEQFQDAYDILSTLPEADIQNHAQPFLMMATALKHLMRPMQALHILMIMKIRVNRLDDPTVTAELKALKNDLLKLTKRSMRGRQSVKKAG